MKGAFCLTVNKVQFTTTAENIIMLISLLLRRWVGLNDNSSNLTYSVLIWRLTLSCIRSAHIVQQLNDLLYITLSMVLALITHCIKYCCTKGNAAGLAQCCTLHI